MNFPFCLDARLLANNGEMDLSGLAETRGQSLAPVLYGCFAARSLVSPKK